MAPGSLASTLNKPVKPKVVGPLVPNSKPASSLRLTEGQNLRSGKVLSGTATADTSTSGIVFPTHTLTSFTVQHLSMFLEVAAPHTITSVPNNTVDVLVNKTDQLDTGINPVTPTSPITQTQPTVTTLSTLHTPTATTQVPTVPTSSSSDSDTDSDSSSATCSDSDSSSDDDMGSPPMLLSEGIELPKVKGLPRVTASILMAAILRDLEDYVEVHFGDNKKPLPETRKMRKIAGCFANQEHLSWVLTESGKQPADATFPDFMDKMCTRFLPNNWEIQVHNEREAEKMLLNDKVKKKNAILKNTPSHLEGDNLQKFLQACLAKPLLDVVWDAVTVKGDCVFEMMNLAMSDRKTDSASTSTSRCPPLTADERKILSKFSGCFKCRKPFQTHMSKDCTTAWPCREGYRALERPSQQDINAWNKRSSDSSDKRSRPDKTTPYPAKRQRKDTTAAVISTTSEGEILDSDDDVIAAVQEGGDTTDSNIRGKHLYWDCMLTGPNSNSPIQTTALLDSGTYVILICKPLVNKLGLQRYSLKDNFSIRGATTSTRSVLKDYVLIRVVVYPLDRYESQPGKALVIDELYTPIILGMPFLTANLITIDHKARLVRDTEKDYVLIGPKPKAIEHKSDSSAQLQRSTKPYSTTLSYRKLLLDELREKLLTTQLSPAYPSCT
ncbi:hypothetical protein AGABI1DRAFT_92821 [Agaricus bisporus var. burnettii JB137-S8]|uniref:Uncharacterized protein n=1 Tax=Agaricus bisporus var. burnettii (strain JB137-S8 / ATCC MYA-4627 / FGSC 10392) TaxID=597362 RepID=K5VVQ0_AGABU|nr:uncharacterized protein AGABI1DRAFT_92821 [Agaricus bisporus var. burnettii JB137-S8]EKM78549.1 hypothetical protein AGABI1DRAFT_92821 [Agaricus bisporus var. burnettii JB137-S8]